MNENGMTRLDPAELPLARWRKRAALAGGLFALVWVAGAFLDPRAAFAAYLWSYLLFLGLALGALGWLLIHHMVGGRWGVLIRRPLEAACGTLPLWALLFLPVVAGAHWLYPWANPALAPAPEALEALAHRAAYANWPFFLIRAVALFGTWLLLADHLRRWSFEEDSGGARASERLRAVAGPGLVAYILTASFAATDWIMALEPLWYSTIFGLIVIGGQFVAALALALACVSAFTRLERFRAAIAPQVLNDLGNLLLAAVMTWAYLAFSQFLIIWSGNLPREAVWYVSRLSFGWQWVAIAVIVFHFALPFLALLFRAIKRVPRRLAAVAGMLLAVHVLNALWTVVPSVRGVSWLDPVAFLALGGLWLAAFAWKLADAPLLPLQPAIGQEGEEVAAHGG